MTDSAAHVRGSPATPERRQHPRRKINDICYVVFLDGVNGGLVLDISETGLLLQAALQVTGEGVSRLRFQLPSSGQSSDEWIEVGAQLVWVSESGTEAGARFLELPEGAQARIKECVGNRDVPISPASIPAEQIVSQQTPQESRGPARIPAEDLAHSAAAPRSLARPERETMLPLWGLGRVLCWVAVAVAVLLGFRYSPQLSQLPKLGRSKEARNILASAEKAARFLYAKAVTFSVGGSPRSQAPRLPPNGLKVGAVPPPSIGRQSTPLALPPKSAESEFGTMVTQPLSPGPTAPEDNAAGIRSQARAQRRTQRGPQPRNVPFPTHTDTPEPLHDVALVAAPAIGAPPARVILEREPVSASSLVAVTESRSILVTGSVDPTEELHLGKLVSHVEPAYPVAALARDAEGTVRVRAFIGRSGEVLRVQLLSGPATPATAAMTAIRQWRYGATLLNGQAIESRADITVFFRPR